MAEKTRKSKDQEAKAPEVSPGFAHIPVSAKTGVFRSAFPAGVQEIPGSPEKSAERTFLPGSLWQGNRILRVLSRTPYSVSLLTLPEKREEEERDLGDQCQVLKLYKLPGKEELFLEELSRLQAGEEASPSQLSSGLKEGYAFCQSSYISLPSLDSLIAAQAPYSEHEALYIVYTVSRILEQIREKYSCIHGRLKPSKILFSRSARPLFLGLGSGEICRNIPEIREKEKLYYLSPEYIKGEPLSWQSDIYSLGIILFQLLTGVLPFYSPSREELKEKILTGVLPFPSERNQSCRISPRTWSVLSRMTMKEPSQRFAAPEKYFDALVAADKALEEVEPPAEKHQTTIT